MLLAFFKSIGKCVPNPTKLCLESDTGAATLLEEPSNIARNQK